MAFLHTEHNRLGHSLAHNSKHISCVIPVLYFVDNCTTTWEKCCLSVCVGVAYPFPLSSACLYIGLEEEALAGTLNLMHCSLNHCYILPVMMLVCIYMYNIACVYMRHMDASMHT